MKRYPFILIDKADMKTLHHFDKIDDVVNAMTNKNGVIKDDKWIVIKNEVTIVDLSPLTTVGEDRILRRRQLKTLLMYV
jgi:hypothetical protein